MENQFAQYNGVYVRFHTTYPQPNGVFLDINRARTRPFPKWDAMQYATMTHGILHILPVDGSEDIKTKPWVLLDKDNGSPEYGIGYLWLFSSKKEAVAHKKAQNAKKICARLVGTWHIDEISSEFLKQKKLGIKTNK